MKNLFQDCIRGHTTAVILVAECGEYSLVTPEGSCSYYIIDKKNNVYAESYIKEEDQFEKLNINLLNKKDVEKSKELIKEQPSYKFFKKFLKRKDINYII